MITLRLNRIVIISVMYAELYLIVMRLVKIANSPLMIIKQDVLYVLIGHLYFNIFTMFYLSMIKVEVFPYMYVTV
jgi:uncharacterized protein YunC (DUF1805 family)